MIPELTEAENTGDTIRVVHTTNGIVEVRLSNPARRNAISMMMWQALSDYVTNLAETGGPSIIILRGDDDLNFSSGAFIGDFDAARDNPDAAKIYDDLVEDTCEAIESLPQPTIAMIRGACYGAGASLAASCDLRVATEDAFFAIPAAQLGLGYDPRGITRFMHVFGVNATRQMLYTADRMPAARLHALGGVQVLARNDEVEEITEELAQRIANNAPLTLKAAKVAIRAQLTNDSELATVAEELYKRADRSLDYQEGRRAFAEKRPPRFTEN